MFDPARALESLSRHDVRFVLIGGFAGAVHGASPVLCVIEICEEQTTGNADRLAAAMRHLDAKPRAGGGIDDEDGDRDVIALTTAAGPIDVVGSPPGTNGFADIESRASTYDLGDGLLVRVASIDDLIRIAQSWGRRTDGALLHELTALRQRIAEREQKKGR